MSARGQLQSSASLNNMEGPVRGIDQHDIPIFSQDWWIEIARGTSNYRDLMVVRGNTVIGRLPLALSKDRLGLFWGFDLHWSHLGGPIVDQSLSRAEQAQVISSLLDQLPRWVSFRFVCNPDLSYADLVRSAFIRAGFEHTTQKTYLRSPAEGNVLDTRKNKHKGHFKRAAKALDCVDITAKEFVNFYEANLRDSGKKCYSPLESLTCLIEEAVSRGQARVIAAKHLSGHQSGKISPALYDAAVAYVWDRHRCYYWLSTYRIPSESNSFAKSHPDATKLLALKAMEHAQDMNLIFDSDGITTPGTENLYRNMLGLRLEQRRDVFWRATALERLHQKFRETFRPLVGSHSGSAVAVSRTIALDQFVP